MGSLFKNLAVAPYCPQEKVLAFLLHHDLALTYLSFLPYLLSPTRQHVHTPQRCELCIPSLRRGCLLLLSVPRRHSQILMIFLKLNPLPEMHNHPIRPCYIVPPILHGAGYGPIVPRSLPRTFFYLEFFSLPSVTLVFHLCLYPNPFCFLPTVSLVCLLVYFPHQTVGFLKADTKSFSKLLAQCLGHSRLLLSLLN